VDIVTDVVAIEQRAERLHRGANLHDRLVILSGLVIAGFSRFAAVASRGRPSRRWPVTAPLGAFHTSTKIAREFPAIYHSITISSDARILFESYPDGTIRFGPAFVTKDQASLDVWQSLADTLPQFKAMLKDEETTRH